MIYELKFVELLSREKNIIIGDLKIYEESPEEIDLVQLRLAFENTIIIKKDKNLFSALLELRKDLEKIEVQIKCNGAALNVYPSPMQLSMGSGRTAHRLTIGKQTRKEDIIDIFECDKSLVFTSIYKQKQFYESWIKSILNINK